MDDFQTAQLNALLHTLVNSIPSAADRIVEAMSSLERTLEISLEECRHSLDHLTSYLEQEERREP